MIRIYFMTFIIQQLNIIEGKLITFYWFQITLISILSESKSSFITSSASSLMMISMLLLLECITCSSSLFMEKSYLLLLIEFSV